MLCMQKKLYYIIYTSYIYKYMHIYDVCIHLNVYICIVLSKNILMKTRANRMDAIKALIQSNDVASQEELLQLLLKNGYVLTQATLSRDLKLLKIAKIANSDGKYVYTLSDEIKPRIIENRTVASAIVGGFLSLNFSGNLAVIRTLPGYASGMAYHIDNHSSDEILGTIAGDDTIMLILRENTDHQDIRNYISIVLSGN